MEQVKPGKTHVQRYLHILLRILVASALVILLIWAIIYIYFRFNKQSLLQKVTQTVSEKLRADVKVQDLGINFLVNFPYVTLRLENVTIRDSLYQVHKRDLLKTRKLFISSTTFQLLTGKIQPSKIVIENGQLFLFTDGRGYTNRYILSSKKEGGGGSRYSSLPDKIVLKDVRLMMYDVPKRKLHEVFVRKLNCGISLSGGALSIKTKLDATIHNLIFNLQKGSYAKNKVVRADLKMRFDTLKRELSIKNQSLRIGGQLFRADVSFSFNDTKNFRLQLAANRISFQQAKLLLTDAVRQKIDSIDFARPVDLRASIAGRTAYKDTPLVQISMTVKDNKLLTPNGDFDNCSFNAAFTNQVSDTTARIDENSAIRITGFKADWEGIPIVSEKADIVNLKHPVVTCDIQSNTDLSKLDDAIGSESFHFIKGEARTKLYYHGPVGDSTDVSPYISGSFSFNNAEMEYIPRGIKLTAFNGDIIFDSSDIRMKELKGKVQGSPITINAEIKNFFALMDIDPGKLELTSSIYMPLLDIQHFRSFLGQRTKQTARKAKRRLAKLSRSIDRVMEQCNMNSRLRADKVTYKRFTASDVNANVFLTNNTWRFSNVSLQHADGSLNMDGSLENVQGNSSSLTLNAKLQRINISKLFHAFNNFGLDDISSENIRGLLTTNIRLTGMVNNEASLMPSSLNGTIDLSLQKGELINFEPLQKMSFFLLKKRDFSNLEFAELKNRFELQGQQIVINRMEVQSTALSMYVEGRYDLKGDSTDLVIQVPLSNLKKRKPDYVPENKGVNARTGMSVYVRAKSGKGDEIDFQVGLFRKKSVLEKMRTEETNKR